MTKVKVILYHAKWCGHCKDFMSDWNKLKEAFVPIGIQYEEYEADENRDIVDKANIQGFPTIVIVTNGVQEEYHKGRDFDSILKFVESKKETHSSEKEQEQEQEQIGGIKNKKFYEKYLKYKAKYLKLKKNKASSR